MKTAVIQGVMNPDMGYAFTFNDNDFEEGKRLMKLGWDCWWSSQEGDWDQKQMVGDVLVDQEYVDSCWGVGYTEPTLELLNAADIKYAELDCHDTEGNFDIDMIFHYDEML